MSAKPLEARLKRLEEASRHQGDGRIRVIIRGVVEEGTFELRGYRYRGGVPEVETLRRPGESNEALLDRAVMASPMNAHGVCVLREIRR